MNEEIALDEACKRSFDERFQKNEYITCCAVEQMGDAYQQFCWYGNENNIICGRCRSIIIQGRVWDRLRDYEEGNPKIVWFKSMFDGWKRYLVKDKKLVVKKKYPLPNSCENCGENPIAQEVKCGFDKWCEKCDTSLYSTKYK